MGGGGGGGALYGPQKVKDCPSNKTHEKII